MSVRLLESLVTTEPLAEAFSDRAVLAAMLEFEVALARAEARCGVIPTTAAEAIARAAQGEAFDAGAIARAARDSATIAVPIVDALTARVAAIDPAASTYVHWGATSQDVTDTALVLCLTRALLVLQADDETVTRALRRLSDAHADTVMLGRTLLQPAPPITFGLKAAEWFAGVHSSGTDLMRAFQRACVLEFGGAVGTLAALGTTGLAVAAELARELRLPDPGAPWHTRRDRLAALVAACGVYCGTLGKIARDITLLMQHEVGEAAEPGGGSSTMPHKQNPALCAATLAAATRVPGMVASFLAAMPQEHERGIGSWGAEAATIAAVVQATGAATASIGTALDTLRVDSARMRDNIAATRDVVFAERAMILLAPAVGRDRARRIISSALARVRHEKMSFAAALAADGEAAAAIDTATLADLALPEAYLGVAAEFRHRLLAAHND